MSNEHHIYKTNDNLIIWEFSYDNKIISITMTKDFCKELLGDLEFILNKESYFTKLSNAINKLLEEIKNVLYPYIERLLEWIKLNLHF